MKKIILSLLLLSISMTGFCTTDTVTAANDLFIPDTLITNIGDSVDFQITSSHDAVEVSQATWNSNNSTSNGGFVLPFGGGLVLPAQLTVGTHWYVCTPHVLNTIPMKAVIIVQSSLGIAKNKLQTNISVYPNPFSTQTTLSVRTPSEQTDNFFKNATLTVDNCFGQTVAQIKNLSGQTITFNRDNLPSGLYFVRLTEENKTIAVDKLVITDK